MVLAGRALFAVVVELFVVLAVLAAELVVLGRVVVGGVCSLPGIGQSPAGPPPRWLAKAAEYHNHLASHHEVIQ